MMHKSVGTSLINNSRAELTSLKESTREMTASFSGKMHHIGDIISSFAQHLIESVKSKEAELEARAKPIIDNIDAHSLEFSVATNKKIAEWKMTSIDIGRSASDAQHDFSAAAHHKADTIKESLKESGENIREKATEFSTSASDIYEEMKGKFGGFDSSLMAAEEKERARRMKEKIDPVLEGRKHRMESELLHTIKPVN